MRRLLSMLMILLVVLLAGLSSLVLLVNPNDFRDDLQQSAARAGYQLHLDGDLRWHVWPRLSILTGQTQLAAFGAKLPLVNAENMRLDVALLPLLSHQLRIHQVVLKNAVIQLNDASQPRRPANAPVAPSGSQPPVADEVRYFTLEKLHIADSMLILHDQQGAPLIMRDVNLDLTQDAQHQGQLSLSGYINRNQRDFNFSLDARVDASHYPRQWQADLSQFRYQLRGADLPREGLNGEGRVKLRWQTATQQLSISELQLFARQPQTDQAADSVTSRITGSGYLLWQTVPEIQLALQIDQLNIDRWLPMQNSEGTPLPDSPQVNQPSPVIAHMPAGHYRDLLTFNGQLALNIDHLHWRGLALSGVQAQLRNQAGLLTIAQLNGTLGQGQFALPGTLDARDTQPLLRITPAVTNLPLAPLLQAFGYPAPFSGTFSLHGEFSGATFSAPAFRRHWQGHGQLSVQQLSLNGLNVTRLIDQTLASDKNALFDHHPALPAASEPGDDSNATRFARFTASLTLDNGSLTLDTLDGQSAQFALSGNAQLDLLRQQCDARLQIHLTHLPVSDNPLLTRLSRTPVPLRIYGDWSQLNYNFQLNDLLQNDLRDRARQRLRQWLHQSDTP